jgi:hypothetical protein
MLGVDPARFPTEPPACYRASWQPPGWDSHPLATTSLCPDQVTRSTTSKRWAHSSERGVGARRTEPGSPATAVLSYTTLRDVTSSKLST